MSYMTRFRTAKDFGEFLRDQTNNLTDTTQTTSQDTANFSPATAISNDDTESQTLDSIGEPSLLLQSNSDRTSPKNSVAPSPTSQSTSRRRAQTHEAHTRHAPTYPRYITRATTAGTASRPRQSPIRLDGSGSHGQNTKPCPQNQQGRGSKRQTGTQAGKMQYQPPKKRQRTAPARWDTAEDRSTTGETEEMIEAAASDEESESMGGRSDNGASKIRKTNGVMEWFDKEAFLWKPAGYHCNYRAELLALAAQQPAAPPYTEDMGTNHTSFSPLTQGWNEDPASIVDFRGRRVFQMKERPADWIISSRYRPLIYNGLVMLDHEDNAVRDIPLFPLTLEAQTPEWFLEGLRRCISTKFPDIVARMPAGKVTSKRIAPSTIPQKITRWLENNRIPHWHPRPNSQKKKQPPAASDSYTFINEPNFSAETAYEPGSTFDTAHSRAGLFSSDAEEISWDTNTLADLGGHADTSHLPNASPYALRSGVQRAPAYNNNPFQSQNRGKRKFFGGSGHDNGDPIWDQNFHTGMPIPQTESAKFHEGNLDPNILISSLSYSPQSVVRAPTVALGSTMRRIGIQKQPRSYGGQRHGNSVTANANNPVELPDISSDPPNSLFNGEDFRYTAPRTTAEAAFIHAILDYTRQHYKSLMLQEPPESSRFASYAELYTEMQQDLDMNWLTTDPPQLLAIGPVAGGIANW